MSWKYNLQSIVALSTTEAEYIAFTKAVKEVIWFKGITSELGLSLDVSVVYSDSQSVIHLSKNSVYQKRTKHINVRLHFIRDVLSNK